MPSPVSWKITPLPPLHTCRRHHRHSHACARMLTLILYMLVQIFVLLGLLVSTLWIENDFLLFYRELSRYSSILFLLLQILLLIEFGYSWNEKWLEYDERNECEGSCCGWKTAIIVSSLSMYIGSIVLWVVMYVVFGKEGCGAQLTLITLTIIVCVALTILSCTKVTREHECP